MTQFTENKCDIIGANQRVIAVAIRQGSLYYLNRNAQTVKQEINITERQESKECLWHRRFGHHRIKNLQKMSKGNLVSSFSFDIKREIDFCEICISGKHHKSHFPISGGTRSKELLGLVHSDLCGKINTQSLGGAEYFLAFIDDKTRYVCVYPLKHKDEVFDRRSPFGMEG